MALIEVTDLCKHYTRALRPEGPFSALRSLVARKTMRIEALAGIDFSVEEGELLGYIGPNGAGKSTTVKILSGIMHPSSGSCVIAGRVPWQQRREHVADIGVVFGQRSQLWWDVPVIDSYALLRDIYRVSEETYQKNLKELTEVLQIGDLLSVPARQLSLGQRMRCEMVAALLHGPRILFLDEPTIGLDAVSKLAVREFLTFLNRSRGVTMILTTHDMEDIVALCSRVMVIGHGKLLYDGDLAALRARFESSRTIIAEYDQAIALPTLEGALSVQLQGNNLHVVVGRDKGAVPMMLSQLEALGDVADVRVETPPIDHMIATMYKELSL